MVGVRFNSSMNPPLRLDLEHIDLLIKKREETISRQAPQLLHQFPVNDYIALFSRYPKSGSYGHVSREVLDRTDAIRAQAGEVVLQQYHQLLLLQLIHQAPNRLKQIALTDDLRVLTERDLVRIAATIESPDEPAFYNYAEDRFQKALAICKLTLTPAGAQKIHLNRLPLRTLLLRSPLGALRLVAKLGGVQPCYDMHTDSNDLHLLADYNLPGWSRFYRRVAKMLELHPMVKCVWGSGWLFDPEMERVSPHLTYLRLLVTENGGHLLRFGSSSQDLENATRTSRTRRRLVAEGRYTPTSYLVCWPRKPLLEWASRAA